MDQLWDQPTKWTLLIIKDLPIKKHTTQKVKLSLTLLSRSVLPSIAKNDIVDDGSQSQANTSKFRYADTHFCVA